MQWAFNQDIKPSSMKFVLVSLGDNAQHDGMAWPSIAALVQKTGQDRKTVIAALDKLEALGYLSDSGKRCGKTGQVKVYQFNFARQKEPKNGTVNTPSVKNAENGTVPKTEQFRNSHKTVPDFPPNSTVFPSKSTENGTRNPQEPKEEPKGNPQGASRGKRLAADWVLPKSWGEWAKEQCPQWTDEQVRRVALMFRNYWTAKSGKDACKLDWLATWQNWCLKEAPAASGMGANRQESLEQTNREVAMRLANQGIAP
jgi:Helix-turn-helix domain